MEIDLVVKNYRCFPDENPARLRIGNGFIALLGQNNSGKTALLRFFYEFRNLFHQLAQGGMLMNGLRGIRLQFARVQTHDMESIFSRANDRPLTIEITLSDTNAGVELTLPRGNPNPVGVCAARLLVDGSPVSPGDIGTDGNRILVRSQDVDLASFIEAFRRISRTVYIPAFRNAARTNTRPAGRHAAA